MNGGFEANPEGLMNKGKTITEIYEAYTATKNEVQATADKISSAWNGADSAGYVTAIHSYDEDFKQLATVLAKIGDILYRHGARLADSRDAIKAAASKL